MSRDYLAGVRHAACPLCWARPGEPCQRYYPPADHLARWLAAFDAGYVAQAHLTEIIGRLTVITRQVLVPACYAQAA